MRQAWRSVGSPHREYCRTMSWPTWTSTCEPGSNSGRSRPSGSASSTRSTSPFAATLRTERRISSAVSDNKAGPVNPRGFRSGVTGSLLPIGDVPREDQTLEDVDDEEQNGAHEREQHQSGENARGGECALRRHDDVAETGAGGDELADNGPDERERNPDFHPAEQAGERIRKLDLDEQSLPSRTHGTGQIDQVGIKRR